jgi:N-acyl-D-aspartate/D-glutamate deacylase
VSYDTVIRNGRWFEAITPCEPDATDCPLTVDAAGKW